MTLIENLRSELEALKIQSLFKSERPFASPQGGTVEMQTGHGTRSLINLCSNNYLGLSNDGRLIDAAHSALDAYGFGLSSVRFICGTQTIHQMLEKKLSGFLKTENSILFPSCFDANTGLFETLLGAEDAIISDALNHASIIDGVRLCKARRFRYANNDMDALEQCLKDAEGARYKLIATDGVFSMDGIIANLPAICDLAEKYDALVMVDDSHAVGFVGPDGAGTPDYWGVQDRIDIVTGTFGKALGGASGGYVSGKSEIVEWLRQKSRPYLFSNSLAPVITATTSHVLDIIGSAEGAAMRDQLHSNAGYFRTKLQDLGFDLIQGTHPIVPVMLGDAAVAAKMANLLMEQGVFVTAFSYPVVPMGQARIRTQMSAALTQQQLDTAIAAFASVGRELGLIN